jgi:molybdenum cofactor biosynthesis enzyme MoaA
MWGYREIFDSLLRYFPSRVVLSGGEPLLFPCLEQVLDCLASTKNQIVLATNLTVLPKQIEAIARRICWFDVSLHGYDRSSYATMRGKDCYRAVLQNLQRLKAVEPQTRIAVNYVLHQGNLSELERVLENLARIQVGKLRLANLVPTDASLKCSLRPIEKPEDFRKVRRLLKQYAGSFPVVVPLARKKRRIAESAQIVIDHCGRLCTSEGLISSTTDPEAFYLAMDRRIDDNIALFRSIEKP